MKNLFTIATICFLGVFAIQTASAQCAKSSEAKSSCCMSKSKASVEVSEDMQYAMKVQNVEKQVCETTGTTTFFIKTVNAETAEASTQEVAFDETLGRFVNVSPSKACNAKTAAEKEACQSKSASSGAACCKSKATSEIK
jgi:hypothetical protein